MKGNYFKIMSGGGSRVSVSMDYIINFEVYLEGSLNPVKLRLFEGGDTEVRPRGAIKLSSYYEGDISLDPEKVLTFRTNKVTQNFIKKIETQLTEQLRDPESDLNYIIRELAENIIEESYGYKEREELGRAVLEEKIKELTEKIKKSPKTTIEVNIIAEKEGEISESFGGYHSRPSFEVGEVLWEDGFEEDDFNTYVTVYYDSLKIEKEIELSDLKLNAFTAYIGSGFVEVWETVFLRTYSTPTDDDIVNAIETLGYDDEYDITKKEELERFMEEHVEEFEEWWSEVLNDLINEVISRYQ